jgi:hypothetical protein
MLALAALTGGAWYFGMRKLAVMSASGAVAAYFFWPKLSASTISAAAAAASVAL